MQEQQEKKLFDDGMTFGDHLEELRLRLILALLGLFICSAICLAFGKKIIIYIQAPYVSSVKTLYLEKNAELQIREKLVDENGEQLTLASEDSNDVFEKEVKLQVKAEMKKYQSSKDLPSENRLIAIAPAEAFLAYMKVSFICGLVISCPWVFYQIWMFVAAGLYASERKYVRNAVPFCAVLFIVGVTFFLIVIAPLMMKFFLQFADFLGLKSQWRLREYISLMASLMFVFGAAFQTPIFIFVLYKIGLVSIETFKKNRRIVILVIFFIAACATPPDVISQIALAIPVYLLYELGIILCVLSNKKQKQISGDS